MKELKLKNGMKFIIHSTVEVLDSGFIWFKDDENNEWLIHGSNIEYYYCGKVK